MKNLLKKWLKRLFRHPHTQGFLAYIAHAYIQLVYKTTRWRQEGYDIPLSYRAQNKGFITCFWHNRLLMACYGWPKGDQEFHMLISPHADGQLIAKTVKHQGIHTIAGSSNRGGTAAMRQLIRLLKQGHSVGITPDGPRGPCYHVSQGTLALAKLAKVDILPFTYATSHYRILGSWDRFRLALPFGRGVFSWGTPFQLDPEQPMEEQQKALEDRLITHMNTVDALCQKKP